MEKDDKLYYYENGKVTYKGLIAYGDGYIYVNSKGQVMTGKYYVSKTNGLMDPGYYTFGEDGVMLPEQELKNGVVEKDGVLYYYENGKTTYKGLTEYEGGLIYVNSKGQVVTGDYYVSKTNDLKPAGYYTFGEDGKLVVAALNGIVEKDGKLYYYENNQRTYKGLVAYEDGYIYVNSKGEVMTGKYFVSKTNGLMDMGYYTFGADGMMIQG